MSNNKGRLRNRIEKAHDSSIWSVDWYGDYIATGSISSTQKTKLWNSITFDSYSIPSSHIHGVVSVSFNKTAPVLLTSSLDSLIQFWNVEMIATQSGKTKSILEFKSLPGGAWGAKFDNAGSVVGVTGHGGDVNFYSPFTGERLLQKTLHTNVKFCHCLAFSPDSKLVAAGAPDGTVRIFDIASGKRTQVLATHILPVRCVSFNADGTLLFTGSDDGHINSHDIEKGTLVNTFSSHSSWVLGIACPGNNPHVFASASHDSTVKLWDCSSPQSPIQSFKEQNAPVWSIAWNNKNNNEIAAGSEDCSLAIYSLI
jgi:WD repeat-containing protein 61